MIHARRAALPSAFLLAAAVLPVQPAHAQERLSTTDYQRAERFLNWHADPLVAGDEVNPEFLADGNRFWYRNKTMAGFEFVLIDPVANARRPVFDHARLASAMSLAADTAFESHKLPFETFEFRDNERAIEFEARKRRFRCTLTDYTCTVGDTLPDTNPYVASPDSTREVFYRDYNLWVRPFGGGDSTQITTDGEEYWSYGASERRPYQVLRNQNRNPRPQVIWSPDSKKLLAYRTDEREVEHHHYISYTSQRPRHFSQPYALPGDSIVPVPTVHIIDLEKGTNIALDLDPVANQLSMNGSPRDSVWSPDSRTFRFHYLTRASKAMYLVEADAETGSWRFLAADSAKTWVETNPQGGASWAVTADGNDVIWWSERDGWAHLWLFDGRKSETFDVAAQEDAGGDGGSAMPVPGKRMPNAAATVLKNRITGGDWFVKRVEYVDEAARQIYFTAHGREEGRIPYYAHLYRIGFDGSGLTLLTPEDANHEITFTPSGRFFIDSYSRVETPPVTVLRSARDGRVIRTLEEADISRIEEMDWKPGEIFTVKARDGVTDLYGVIYFPSNLDPEKKYPVVEYIYPGPQVGSVRPWGFSVGGENRAMAELGFIVVTLDHLGTPLRSKAFHDNYYGNFIDNGLPDHIAALKQLAARYPFMDLDRVGIWGHSGGGFASTDALLRYPDFYKVAVSGAGNHDNRSYNIYWAEKYQGLLERDTVKSTDNFEASANKTYAKNLKGKLLLMHGDMDDNVHPAMTIQLVDELIKANRDFDLIIAPDRAHGLNEPYFIRRRWDYFVRHLMGAEPPENYEIQRAEGG